MVEGRTLGSYGSIIPRAVAKAALRALSALHATPGFLHGDMHVNNIIIAPSQTADDTEVTCRFVDMGRLQLGATAAQQRQEWKKLQQLVRKA